MGTTPGRSSQSSAPREVFRVRRTRNRRKTAIILRIGRAMPTAIMLCGSAYGTKIGLVPDIVTTQ